MTPAATGAQADAYAAGLGEAVVSAGPVRLLEAVVERSAGGGQDAVRARGLVIELPGGSRMRIESPVHLPMAAELVTLIAQSARVRC